MPCKHNVDVFEVMESIERGRCPEVKRWLQCWTCEQVLHPITNSK